MDTISNLLRSLRNLVAPTQSHGLDLGISEPSKIQVILHKLYLFFERMMS